jgi:hypothetical protein
MLWQNNIGLSRQILAVQPESKAKTMQQRTDFLFRRRVR